MMIGISLSVTGGQRRRALYTGNLQLWGDSSGDLDLWGDAAGSPLALWGYD